LLASEIGAIFFPQSSKELQLVNSFGVYLAAFVMRPIGAILFGEIGDRVVGRKHALVFSILLITVPSVLMGVLPGFETLGWASPILLVILRMMQGLSVGGQLAGSYVLSIEQSSVRNRGFRGSICDASSVGGFLLASLVTTCVRFSFTSDQVDRWAWRLPFLFSLLLAPILYHIVNQTEESEFWAERNEQKETEDHVREAEIGSDPQPAIFDLMESPFRRRQLAGMIGLLSSTTSTFYILFLFCPVFLSELKGVMTQAHADSMNFVVVGFYIVFLLLAGQASDRFPHRRDLMRIGLPGVIVAAPVMFSMFETESMAGIFLGQILLSLCLALVNGGMAALEVELWMSDPTLSFTGVAVGHNTAATLFGGTMPLVATGLYYQSTFLVDENEMYPNFFNTLIPQMLPGLYISLLGLISLFCLSFVVKHPHDVRTGSRQLQAAVMEENRKFKQKTLEAKKKKRKKKMEAQLQNMNVDDVGIKDYLPPTMA
jgi:MHS family proline/betaine transporter-like MFS transporter